MFQNIDINSDQLESPSFHPPIYLRIGDRNHIGSDESVNYII